MNKSFAKPTNDEDNPEEVETLDSFRSATSKALDEGASPSELIRIVKEEEAAKKTIEGSKLTDYISKNKTRISLPKAISDINRDSKFKSEIEQWKKAKPGAFVYKESTIYGFPILFFKGSDGQIYETPFENFEETQLENLTINLTQQTPFTKANTNDSAGMLNYAEQLDRHCDQKKHESARKTAEQTRLQALRASGI